MFNYIGVTTMKAIDFKTVFKHIPTVSYIINNDDQYTVELISEAIEQLTGYAKKMFEKNTFYRDLIHPEDRQAVISHVLEATRKKTNYSLTYRLVHKDGHIIWVIEKGRAVFDSVNHIDYYVGMIDNISDYKMTESLLKNREALLEAILKATETLLSAYDYNDVMHTCFAILGKANRVHRIYYYQNSIYQGQQVTSLKHEWVTGDITPHIDDPNQQNIPFEAMKTFFEPLLRKAPYEYIVDDIEEDTLKEHLKSQQVESILIFPIYVNGTFEGFIGFDDVKVKRNFSLIEKNLLSSFSKSIESAIELRHSIETLSVQTQILETVFESIEDAVALIDQNMQVQLINESMKKYLKTPFKKGMTCQSMMNTTSVLCNDCPVKMSLETGKTHTLETQYHYDGSEMYVEIHSYPIIDKSNHVITGAVQVIRNITERKKMHLKLKHLSETDALTGLYNRTFIDELLKTLNNRDDYYIISIDVDGLKIINDTFGHSRGDTMLKLTADIITMACKPYDTIVARIGGDEFIVIVYTERETILNECLDNLRNQFLLHNETSELYLSTSMGVSRSHKSTTAFDVLRNADSQMYTQKLRKGQSAKSHIISTLLETLKTRDLTTRDHGDRLLTLITEFATVLGMSEAKINQLQTLAEVHDIGKIGIPDSILLKPSKLSETEWTVMKTHPEKGYRITSNSPELAMVSEFVLKHHEHYDGSGYPLGIKGNEIPIESRILLICDAYDAMTSTRPYRQALDKEKAMQELMDNKETQFDPELVDLFIEKVLNRID